MSGRTNYTPIKNTDPMNGPSQINTVSDHFDALVGESRPMAAGLPVSGNWVGRLITTENDGVLHLCVGLPSVWRVVSSEIKSSRSKTAGQSLPTSTWQTVSWPGLETETGITVSGTGVFTVPVSGRYQVSVQLNFPPAGTTGQRVFRVRSSEGHEFQSTQSTPNSAYGATPQLTAVMQLAAGSTFSVEAYQSQGSSINMGGDAKSSFINVDRL